MVIAASPSPQPTSAMRTRSPAVSFAWTSVNAGSHVCVRWLANTGRVNAAWMSCRSNNPNAAPVPLRNSSTMMSIALASHEVTEAHGFMHASLSSSMRTWACAFGRLNRRSPAGLATSSTSNTPATVCCSSHSRAYRSAIPAPAATSPADIAPAPASVS